MDNRFRPKRKRIFELNPCSDKVGRRTKRIINIAASFREKTIKKSRNAMKEKVQLAINLGLKTQQIVRLVLNSSSTLYQEP